MSQVSRTTQATETRRHMMKRIGQWLLRIIGPVILLVIIFYSVDVSHAIELVLQADIALLLIAIFGLFPILIALRSLRWHFIAHIHGVRQSFATSIWLYMAAFSAGFLISDGVSSFVRSVFLYRDGYSAIKSVLVPFWDKAIELAGLLLVGILALLVLPTLILDIHSLYLLAILTASVVIIGVLLFSSTFQRWLLRRLLPIVAKQVKRLHTVDADAILADLQLMRPHHVLELIAFAAGVRLVHFLSVYLLALALGAQLSYVQVSSAMAIAALVVMLPISIAGLGTRELVLIPILGFFGHTAETAVALSFLVALTSTLWRGLGAIAWIVLPSGRRMSEPTMNVSSAPPSGSLFRETR